MKTATAKDVHNEFDKESKSLIKEANKILSDSQSKDNILVSTMKELGFGNSSSVKENAEALEMAKSALHYKLIYPQNNFLTQEAVERICKKYGLLFAKSADYIGDIPAKNQKEIASFKLSDEETMVKVIDREKFKENIKELRKSRKGSRAEKKLISSLGVFGAMFDVAAKAMIDYQIVKRFQKTISKKEFLASTSGNLSLRKELRPEFMIVATPDYLDMKGKEIVGEYMLVDGDPVVLCKVNRGFLQVSCWGDESNMNEFKTPAKN